MADHVQDQRIGGSLKLPDGVSASMFPDLAGTADARHHRAFASLLRICVSAGFRGTELHQLRAGDGRDQGAGKATIRTRKAHLPAGTFAGYAFAVVLTFSRRSGTFGVINFLGSGSVRDPVQPAVHEQPSPRIPRPFAMALIMICIASISVFVDQKQSARARSLRLHRRQGRPFHPDPSGRA